MALSLYIGIVKPNNDTVQLNDIWFQNHVRDIRFGKTEQKIVETIDKVKYAGNRKFKSKFMKGTLVDSSELSTGCKTALNIFTFPDKIFNLAECGENALQVIMNMKHGKAYMNYAFLTDGFNNQIDVIINGETKRINNNQELEFLLEEARL